MNETEVKYYDGHKYDMIVRDLLALDRTKLANERTFLAYVRTTIGCFGAGVAMVKLLTDAWIMTAGWILIAISPLVLIWGIYRYVTVWKKLRG